MSETYEPTAEAVEALTFLLKTAPGGSYLSDETAARCARIFLMASLPPGMTSADLRDSKLALEGFPDDSKLRKLIDHLLALHAPEKTSHAD